jgi:hypothetical protein
MRSSFRHGMVGRLNLGGGRALGVPQPIEQRLFSIRRAQLLLSHSCTTLCEPPARRKRPRRTLQREHCAAQP